MAEKKVCIICGLEIPDPPYSEVSEDGVLIALERKLGSMFLLKKGDLFCEYCKKNSTFYRKEG